MSIVAKSVGRVIDFTLPKLLPSRVRQRLVRSLSDHDHRDNLLDRARALGFRGTWTRDEPDLAGDSRGLARTLGENEGSTTQSAVCVLTGTDLGIPIGLGVGRSPQMGRSWRV